MCITEANTICDHLINYPLFVMFLSLNICIVDLFKDYNTQMYFCKKRWNNFRILEKDFLNNGPQYIEEKLIRKQMN